MVCTTGTDVPPAICTMHPILPAAIMSGFDCRNIGDLSIAQSARNVGLENVVGPRRTATQMALGYIFHHESVLGKQFFRKLRDFLSVLQRTGRVIGNQRSSPPTCCRWLQIDAGEIFGDVLCQRRYLRGGPCEFAILAQHETVVLDHRAATRCRSPGWRRGRLAPPPFARRRRCRAPALAHRRRGRGDGSARRSIARL